MGAAKNVYPPIDRPHAGVYEPHDALDNAFDVWLYGIVVSQWTFPLLGSLQCHKHCDTIPYNRLGDFENALASRSEGGTSEAS